MPQRGAAAKLPHFAATARKKARTSLASRAKAFHSY